MDSAVMPGVARRTEFLHTGREFGPRALRTRARLLDATAALLARRSLLDLSVAAIARRARTSPGTFYHYFTDVEDAALALAERAAAEVPAIVALVDGDLRGPAGLACARRVVEAFVAHWDAQRAVLLLRNHAADRGDPRFHRVRRAALEPLLERLAARIAEAAARGGVSADLHPTVAAAGVLAMLESFGAYAREVRRFRATRAELVETCARLLHQSVTGERLP
jgi:AcrR family transcriptional regulator